MPESPFEKIRRFLAGTDYELQDHEPVYTSAEAAEVRGLPLSTGAKSLLLKTSEGFLLSVLPGDRKLDSKKVKALVPGKSFRFATPDEVRDVMGCAVGACYPFGNLIGVRMVVDPILLSQEEISFNPGVHDRTITMKSADYRRLASPELHEIT